MQIKNETTLEIMLPLTSINLRFLNDIYMDNLSTGNGAVCIYYQRVILKSTVQLYLPRSVE